MCLLHLYVHSLGDSLIAGTAVTMRDELLLIYSDWWRRAAICDCSYVASRLVDCYRPSMACGRHVTDGSTKNSVAGALMLNIDNCRHFAVGNGMTPAAISSGIEIGK